MLGELIKKRLKESQLSHTEFARRIGRSRGYAYAILERDEVTTEDLYRISKALGYNFFAHFHEKLKHLPPFNEDELREQESLSPLEEKLNYVLAENQNLKRIIALLEESKKT